MRKQYHSRPSEEGRRIWDVHRLVDLSKDFPVVEVPLSQIQELQENYWFDDKSPTCAAVAEHAKLIQEVDLRHPIILLSDGRVADGMHRVCRAWMDGHATIKAVRFTEDPPPDYLNVDLEDLPY